MTNSDPPPKIGAPLVSSPASSISLAEIGFDQTKHSLTFSANIWISVGVILVAVLLVLLKARAISLYKSMVIDEAEIGIGSGKVKLRPNYTDRQVAYQIWVELSTRKIGLPIDPQHDVISEIYDSWFHFFSVTRDLIKSIPVARVTDPSTRQIINMSIEVLNEGLRPHLTQYQARFRYWYDLQLKGASAATEEPQAIQKRFPAYDALTKDILVVNAKLAAYRAAMKALVYGATKIKLPKGATSAEL